MLCSHVASFSFLLYRVVIGFDEGTIMVKIGRDEPVASMDNSGKIIWAKHNEIQTVNIRSVGADYEVYFPTCADFIFLAEMDEKLFFLFFLLCLT